MPNLGTSSLTNALKVSGF